MTLEAKKLLSSTVRALRARLIVDLHASDGRAGPVLTALAALVREAVALRGALAVRFDDESWRIVDGADGRVLADVPAAPGERHPGTPASRLLASTDGATVCMLGERASTYQIDCRDARGKQRWSLEVAHSRIEAHGNERHTDRELYALDAGRGARLGPRK